MWIFGNASDEEINEMKKQGWEVQEVEKTHFNKSLDPKYNPEEDADLNEHNEDKLVAVFIDCDMSWQLTQFYKKNIAHEEMLEKQKLNKARRIAADNKFEEANSEVLDIPEDSTVVDHEGWNSVWDGDRYEKRFYYSAPDVNDDSLKGTFVVIFEKNSEKIVDAYSNV